MNSLLVYVTTIWLYIDPQRHWNFKPSSAP